jgi:hypothetical protein
MSPGATYTDVSRRLVPPISAPPGFKAPAELRQAFLASIAIGRPDLRLADKLWNCDELLPLECCDALGLPRGSSYAQAARGLRLEAAG